MKLFQDKNICGQDPGLSDWYRFGNMGQNICYANPAKHWQIFGGWKYTGHNGGNPQTPSTTTTRVTNSEEELLSVSAVSPSSVPSLFSSNWMRSCYDQQSHEKKGSRRPRCPIPPFVPTLENFNCHLVRDSSGFHFLLDMASSEPPLLQPFAEYSSWTIFFS